MPADSHPTQSDFLFAVEIGLNGFVVRATNAEEALRYAREHDDWPDRSWRADHPEVTRLDPEGETTILYTWCSEP